MISKCSQIKMHWEMGTSRYESQTEDKVVKSIKHRGDKLRQLQRHAGATGPASLGSRAARQLRSRPRLLSRAGALLDVCLLRPALPSPRASSHRSIDRAFAPHKHTKPSVSTCASSQGGFSRAAGGPGPNVMADGERLREEPGT